MPPPLVHPPPPPPRPASGERSVAGSTTHYPLLHDTRELRLTTFAFQIAAHTDEAVGQARHRLACIRGQRPRPLGTDSRRPMLLP